MDTRLEGAEIISIAKRPRSPARKWQSQTGVFKANPHGLLLTMIELSKARGAARKEKEEAAENCRDPIFTFLAID